MCRFALRPVARAVSSRITDFLCNFHRRHYEQSRERSSLLFALYTRAVTQSFELLSRHHVGYLSDVVTWKSSEMSLLIMQHII